MVFLFLHTTQNSQTLGPAYGLVNSVRGTMRSTLGSVLVGAKEAAERVEKGLPELQSSITLRLKFARFCGLNRGDSGLLKACP
jgi:hypothetical protein